MSARSRELFGLIPVSLLVTAGFTAVFVSRAEEVQSVTLTYGAIFLGACVFAHLFIRARLPDADPYLFPLAALMTAFGLVMIYRIDEDLAAEQAFPFALALVLFCATIVFLRDHRVLERYRYVIAAAGILLLLLPLVPGIGSQVNGAFLAINLGVTTFQPTEFTKLAIVIFLASYLNDNREVLLRRRPSQSPLMDFARVAAVALAILLLLYLGLDLGLFQSVLAATLVGTGLAVLRERPSLKHFGPLLLVWGLAMVSIVFIRDLGAGLMFFGGFLALLYVATSRFSFVAFGAALFAGGATLFASSVGHVGDRIDIWLGPFDRDAPEGAGQITQSLFAQGEGGLFGVGFGQSLLKLPGPFAPDCAVPFPDCGSVLPAPHTDFIYAVIVNEVGLFGGAALIIATLLFAARGFKVAMLAEDGFSKLLAAGLTAVFALQVFVIVGGVTGAIPLTGVTLPFVSFGGSSLVANFVLLALLLIVSDHARRDAVRRRSGGLV